MSANSEESLPPEFYDNPANMYVAGFIGIPTMNFIPVTIQGSTAKASGFDIELPRATSIRFQVVSPTPLHGMPSSSVTVSTNRHSNRRTTCPT